MKRRILGYTELVILMLILLAGCAAKFDTNEYSRMVDIRHALDESRCANDADARVMSTEIKNYLKWLSIYSQHLPDNANTQTMISAMKNTADEFAERAARSGSSVVYCRLKVRTMTDQIDSILKTTGRRSR
jgi:hypothetical protein